MLVRSDVGQVGFAKSTDIFAMLSGRFPLLLQSLQLLPFQVNMVGKPGEDHDNTRPLNSREWVPAQEGGHDDANKLAGGGDCRVGEGPEPAYG